MKKTTAALVWVVMLAVPGCSRKAAPRRTQPVTVMTSPVRKGTVVVETTVPGTVQPERTAKLLAQVDGEVLALTHREGDPVREGEVLVVIDSSRLDAAMSEAAAQRDLAKAELREARRVLERDRSLFARHGLAEEALERSETNVTTLEARLRQSEGRMASIQAQLDDTEVRAPFAGYVLERWVERGDVVAARTLLLSVASGQHIVAARVSELDVPGLEVGAAVALTADAVQASSSCSGCTGVVSRVYPRIDPATRNTTAEITPEPACAARLRPGMFVRLTLLKDRRDGVETIPNEAVVVRPDGATFAFVVADGAAQERPIRIGLEGRELAEVLDGVSAGEQVVVRGQENLKDGASVKVAEDGAQGHSASPPGGGESR